MNLFIHTPTYLFYLFIYLFYYFMSNYVINKTELIIFFWLKSDLFEFLQCISFLLRILICYNCAV